MPRVCIADGDVRRSYVRFRGVDYPSPRRLSALLWSLFAPAKGYGITSRHASTERRVSVRDWNWRSHCHRHGNAAGVRIPLATLRPRAALGSHRKLAGRPVSSPLGRWRPPHETHRSDGVGPPTASEEPTGPFALGTPQSFPAASSWRPIRTLP